MTGAIIRRQARFVYTPLGPSALTAIGQSAADTIRTRISAGVNANDGAAKPLTPAYAKLKTKRGAKPIRDWKLTGGTLATLGVLGTAPNSVRVGFSDDRAALVAFFENKVEKMFGVSPRDHVAITAAANKIARDAGIIQVR